MLEFTVSIVERPVIHCAGIKVRTTMQKASEDCPNLWGDLFSPSREETTFTVDPDFANQAYGVSVMVDSDTFDYWAVIPLAKGAAVPDGMDVITIPGGMYAECLVSSLTSLGAAYEFIYGEWLQSQNAYTLNMQGVSYELYNPAKATDGLTICCTSGLIIYCGLLEQ